MRKIFYTGVDHGDGSIGIRFYESQACIDLLEEEIPEDYCGEGGGSFMVSGEVAGIDIVTMREVLEEIEERNSWT